MVIKGFRHRDLERFPATGKRRGIQAKHQQRLRLILGALNAATAPGDMNLPGLDFMSCKVPAEGRGR